LVAQLQFSVLIQEVVDWLQCGIIFDILWNKFPPFTSIFNFLDQIQQLIYIFSQLIQFNFCIADLFRRFCFLSMAFVFITNKGKFRVCKTDILWIALIAEFPRPP